MFTAWYRKLFSPLHNSPLLIEVTELEFVLLVPLEHVFNLTYYDLLCGTACSRTMCSSFD